MFYVCVLIVGGLHMRSRAHLGVMMKGGGRRKVSDNTSPLLMIGYIRALSIVCSDQNKTVLNVFRKPRGLGVWAMAKFQNSFGLVVPAETPRLLYKGGPSRVSEAGGLKKEDKKIPTSRWRNYFCVSPGGLTFV